MLDPINGAALADWFEQVVARDAAKPGAAEPSDTVAYGSHPEQVAELWLPQNPAEAAVVVSIHGGAFMAEFDRSLHHPLARELVRRGFAVGNIEYRRAGTGGFSETTGDVCAAIESLATFAGLRTDRLAVFGHSAGGYLTEWVAKHRLVDLAVPIAAVTDLDAFVRSGRDDGGVTQWLGKAPSEDPALYMSARLDGRLPAGVRHVLIHGTADATLHIDQSRTHAMSVRASGDECELIELVDEGHYAFLDPDQAACGALYDVLDEWRSQT